MVFDALPRDKAAQIAGLSDHGLYKALRNPPALAYMRAQMQVLRTSAASRTIAKAEKLMDGAQSEHVQADMTKWLAGLEGISPVQRTENMHVHQHVIPGLTVMRGGWAEHDGDVRMIDSQVHGSGSPHQINVIGEPVPHPEARNAQPAVIDQPAKRGGRGKAPRGEK